MLSRRVFVTRIGAAARIGAVQTPEVDYDDAIREILRQPGDFHMPLLDGRQITLADLATHTSGLPRFGGRVVTHLDCARAAVLASSIGTWSPLVSRATDFQH
jgi:CubicO group peptidase (beta-lactamase class C family)